MFMSNFAKANYTLIVENTISGNIQRVPFRSYKAAAQCVEDCHAITPNVAEYHDYTIDTGVANQAMADSSNLPLMT
jgi:hypothetical protein